VTNVGDTRPAFFSGAINANASHSILTDNSRNITNITYMNFSKEMPKNPQDVKACGSRWILCCALHGWNLTTHFRNDRQVARRTPFNPTSSGLAECLEPGSLPSHQALCPDSPSPDNEVLQRLTYISTQG
jgi:hypothetical protein